MRKGRKRLAASVLTLLCFVLLPTGLKADKPGAGSRQFYEDRGEIVWEVPTHEKWIALTFDDGPDPQFTPQIAELLAQYNGKATFFVVGERTERFPETAKKLIDAGHELANHTYRHMYFRSGTSEQAIEKEIARGKQAIASLGAVGAPWFRPPGGFYNKHIVAAARRQGYTVIMWSWHQDTEDWKAPGVGRIVRKVVDNARNGDFVLFHDHGEGASQTVAALKQILPALHERGFRFVTVTDLMNIKASSELIRRSKGN